MKPRQFNTQGIVLARTDYGEADRILTFLTHDHGKVKAIAKGVRKSKSKLAGGVELFSVSDLTLIIGRGEINTLISSRLKRHYGNIVKNIERTNLAYDFLKTVNKSTEDEPEPAYFKLLDQSLEALDDKAIGPALTQLWFNAQLLRLNGHTPNLLSDEDGKKLDAAFSYKFNLETMNFHKNGGQGDSLDSNNIKFLRLVFSGNSPKALQKVQGVEELSKASWLLVSSILSGYL